MTVATTSRSLGELTSAEVATLLGPRSILCLPIGSIEQHGPHLPLNTDVVLAEEFTRRIMARWGAAYDLWQLPTVAVSLAREHEWAPGTLSLSLQTIAAMLRELARAIARATPTRNLAVINGHGGNRGVLEAVALDLRADFGLNACILHPAAWLVEEQAGFPDIHGGRNETSLMLAAAPHLVRVGQIAGLTTPSDPARARAAILDPAVTWAWTSEEKALADRGVIGEPGGASPELGERLFERVVAKAEGVFKLLLERETLARHSG